MSKAFIRIVDFNNNKIYLLPTVERLQTWFSLFHNHEYPKNIQPYIEGFFNIIHFQALINDPMKYIQQNAQIIQCNNFMFKTFLSQNNQRYTCSIYFYVHTVIVHFHFRINVCMRSDSKLMRLVPKKSFILFIHQQKYGHR